MIVVGLPGDSRGAGLSGLTRTCWQLKTGLVQDRLSNLSRGRIIRSDFTVRRNSWNPSSRCNRRVAGIHVVKCARRLLPSPDLLNIHPRYLPISSPRYVNFSPRFRRAAGRGGGRHPFPRSNPQKNRPRHTSYAGSVMPPPAVFVPCPCPANPTPWETYQLTSNGSRTGDPTTLGRH